MTHAPGSPSYMPPETLVDDPHYDASVDVFSFGALMTETLPEIGPARKYPDADTGIPMHRRLVASKEVRNL